MLVLNPTASLKTVANGGHVQNANGYDIIFVNGAGTAIPFELVGHGAANTTYSPSTGNVCRTRIPPRVPGGNPSMCWSWDRSGRTR